MKKCGYEKKNFFDCQELAKFSLYEKTISPVFFCGYIHNLKVCGKNVAKISVAKNIP